MVKKILLLILLCYCKTQAQGWLLTTPLKETSQIKSMYCTSDNALLLLDTATNQNALYTSLDNGATWNRKELIGVTDLFMLDDNYGFMISNTSIIRTSNKFQTITGNALGYLGLKEVYFIDQNIGFCFGTNGKIIKTIDRGVTWSLTTTNVSAIIKDVYFVNDQTGFACTADGKLLKSTDQGITWNIVENTTSGSLNRILFLNASTGFVSGTGVLKKTTDAGNTWTSQSMSVGGNDFKIWNNKLVLPAGFGTVYISSDLGATWQVINPPNPTGDYYTFGTQGNRMILSSQGRLYATTDGVGWTVFLNGIYRSHLKSVSFADANRGVIVGDGTYSSVVYRTADGGMNWINEQLQLGLNNKYELVHMNTSGDGLFVGEIPQGFRITSDYGDHWNSGPNNLPSGGPYSACWMKSNQDFFIGTYSQIGEPQGLFSWSAAGGWHQDTSLGLITAIHFADDNHGVIGGYSGRIFKTSDGGQTWTGCGLPGSDFPGGVHNIVDLQMVNENLIYADEYRSTDGGLTWQLHHFDDAFIRKYHFFNSQFGYGINSLKIVYKTTDGGLSWIPLNSDELTFSEPDFNAIHFGLDKVVGVNNNSDVYVLQLQNPLRLEEINAPAITTISFYPNPVIDQLHFNTDIKIVDAQLYDLQLRCLPIQMANNTIDMNAFPSGVYIIKLDTNQGVISKKIVKR